jgi:hypothetical protein
MVAEYLCLGHKEYAVDPNARGVLIGLGYIIAVCGAVLLWVEHNSAAPMDFIERHLDFSPDGGDGSIEVLLITVLVMIVTVAAFHWASK